MFNQEGADIHEMVMGMMRNERVLSRVQLDVRVTLCSHASLSEETAVPFQAHFPGTQETMEPQFDCKSQTIAVSNFSNLRICFISVTYDSKLNIFDIRAHRLELWEITTGVFHYF